MSSMSEAGFVQSLLLATPLYFYYQHLAPPGYFSTLLKALVQIHKQKSEEVTNSTQEEQPKTSPNKRKYASDECNEKGPSNNKRSRDEEERESPLPGQRKLNEPLAMMSEDLKVELPNSPSPVVTTAAVNRFEQ